MLLEKQLEIQLKVNENQHRMNKTLETNLWAQNRQFKLAQNQLMMKLTEMETLIGEQQNTIQFLKQENENQSDFISKVKNELFGSPGKLQKVFINKSKTMKSISPDKSRLRNDNFRSLSERSQKKSSEKFKQV